LFSKMRGKSLRLKNLGFKIKKNELKVKMSKKRMTDLRKLWTTALGLISKSWME
jgi:hypothetical protein